AKSARGRYSSRKAGAADGNERATALRSLEKQRVYRYLRWYTAEVAMFDRVTFDPKIMGGRACIRGMRVPVSVIVNQIAHGASFDDILVGYPDLEREDIQQAIEYAAWLAQERVENA